MLICIWQQVKSGKWLVKMELIVYSLGDASGSVHNVEERSILTSFLPSEIHVSGQTVQ